MKRRALQFLVALGLLLTLAACVLAWRGGRGDGYGDRYSLRYVRIVDDVDVTDIASLAADDRGFMFTWERVRHPLPVPGEVASLVMTPESARLGWRASHLPNPPDRGWYRYLHDDTYPLLGTPGFSYARGGDGVTMSLRSLALPAWFVITQFAALAAAPALLLWRAARRRRTRLARGLCPQCGYDLRGAEHERCPECGEGVDLARV